MPDRTAAMIADIQHLVRCESPSDDLDAVARSADTVAEMGERLLGDAPERLTIDGRTHLRWRFGDGDGVLLLGHHDTVWPLSTIVTHPASIEDGILRGPGSFDMKAGLVIAFHALAALPDRDGVTLLITGDEEPGSPTSRTLIEEEARRCAAALVLEAAGPGGALKTARKGVSRYEVHVRGRAAHAGLEPEQGVNATVELSHQIQAVAELAAPDLGTTVTPTRMRGGTTSNTVPAHASFMVDVRARTVIEQQRTHDSILALVPRIEGAAVSIEGGINRPPMEAAASAALFARACRIAERLGIRALESISVGGASDGNYTAGVGTPTLDGLGAVGGGAHADDEHVIVAELPDRTRLLTALVAELLASPAPSPASASAPAPASASAARR
ncbi:M20 family metallopeptidase [Microbacterium sp. MYb62]|uniref:M20 family metallopeptidase n=1 Tax=Microbacterium sp. MYb62 TaxID=1848690 RepID=UPI001C61389F|nr:M20 family metallopeptidase [Microbacterium sp. MYb62]